MRFCSFLLFLLLGSRLWAQQPQPVPGLATQEVYDLLIDNRGFLWVGHELGISRFDGANFRHFTHPQQASLSMTDLVEDPQGRIWCHNFSGQVFYIQNEKLELLQAYDHVKESIFPHMVLWGNDLVLTSVKGLFILNTQTLRGHYVKSRNSKHTNTTTLGVLKDRVIATDGKSWYSYNQTEGMKAIPVDSNIYEVGNNLRMHPGDYGDTLLLLANPSGILKKLVYNGGELKAVSRQPFSSFINTTTKEKEHIWVHTKNKSFTLDGQKEIQDVNLTDVVTSPQGHTWMSSLNKGLLVQYKPSSWEKVAVKELERKDFVRCINVLDGMLIMGTQNARLLVKDSINGKVLWNLQLPVQAGAIEYIRPIGGSSIVISTSSNTYLLDIKNKNYRIIPPLLMSRDVETWGETMFFACPSGLFATPHPEKEIDTLQWKSFIQKHFPDINIPMRYIQAPFFLKRQRSKSVRFDTLNQKLVVAFKDGLYELNSDGMRPVTRNNQPIYASSLEFINNKLFVGTINNGLMIKDGNDIRQITVNEGLASNSIIQIKAVNNHLWLFEGNAVQVLDINAEKVLANIDLPSIGGANAYDVIEVDNIAYLTSGEGLYKISLSPSAVDEHLNSYLNYVVVNNKDTVTASHIKLPYYQNNLLLNVTIPWYNPTQTIYFRYRLRGSNYDESWQTVHGPEQEIRFASLMPGHYTFEAFAMVNGIPEKTGKVFWFTIQSPWWQQWWFFTPILLLCFALFYVFYRFRLKQLLQVETIRRNISSDLHDEVGSTLSSINIYAELAKNESDNKEYLQAIQDNAQEIITQLDDLVWSINPKNDTFEQLIKRMQLFAEPLLAAVGIQYTFTYHPDLLKQKLSINKKRNIYLIFKEAIHNVLKHSQGRHCSIHFYCRGSYLFLEIKDDGKGFDMNNRTQGRSGVNNIMERARQVNARVRIQSHAEKGTLIYIALPLK